MSTTTSSGVVPSRLICNQITSGTVRMLTRLTGLPASSVVVTGHDVGHIGPADIIVGFDRLRRAGQVDGPVERRYQVHGRANGLPPVGGQRRAHLHLHQGRQA